MFIRRNDSRKSKKHTGEMLRLFLALQVLLTFSLTPALALESVSGESPEVSQRSLETAASWSESDSESPDDATAESGTAAASSVVEAEATPAPAATGTTDTTTTTSIDSSPEAAAPEEAPQAAATTDATTEVDQTADAGDGAARVDETNAQPVTEASSSSEKITDKTTQEADKSESAEAVADSPAVTETEEISSTEAVQSDSADKQKVSSTEASETQDDPVKAGSEDKVADQALVEEEEDDLAFLQEGYIEKDEDAEVIYIDNDEQEIVEETIAYEDLPTDDAQTRIKAGAQFPVVMVSNISSKTAKKGDVMQARLKYDLKIGPKLIAKKGSMVTGHIDYALPARTVLHSMVSPTRWYRNSGCLGIMFDEIINEKNEHIALNAKPARKDRIVKNKAEGRLLGVNHDGQITGPWGQQLKYKAIRVGLNAALAPAGVFSFGAMPVALGVMGAVNPSFAFMKPVGTNVPHRRIKGFCWGFLSGIPGSWIIEDTVTKGQEALVRPGDEFLVELHQEFTGQVLTEAQLMPGASGKVSGDVDDERFEKTEKKGLFRFKKGKSGK